MTLNLARPKWWIGQVLRPEHFRGLELALTADAALRSSVAGLPTSGLLRLEWSGPVPDNGVLWVTALTAILPDGLLVDIPGNAKPVSPLDLKLSGRPRVAVYAHVFTDEEAVAQAGLEPAPKEIARHLHQVKLSTDGSLPGSSGRICLGEFALGDDGKFRLSTKVVPALLRLHSTPYFGEELSQLRHQMTEFSAALEELALAVVSRGESLTAVQRTRIELSKLAALLDDASDGLHHHPYVIFSALRSFAIELCVLDNTAVPWEAPRYQHDKPRECFDAVFTEIEQKLRTAPPESPCVPFEIENGRWCVSIPDVALAADELFIAVRSPNPGQRDPLEGVRLASPERLRHVREHVLRGVRAVLTQPPFRHAFGPSVDFYRVGTPGTGEPNPEWTHVVRARALAFYHEPRFEGYRVLLCWSPRR